MFYNHLLSDSKPFRNLGYNCSIDCYAFAHCVRPAVPEGKTYPGAELILTPPATPEPVLIDEVMIGRHG